MAYRILSLDGGGTWALIQVRALIALYDEKTKGNKVLSDFDLAAANSGGSIVLGGLIEDLALKDILQLFEDEQKRRTIFSPTHSVPDIILRKLTGFSPKYSAEAKLPALETLMPNRGNIPLVSAASGIRRPVHSNELHLLIIAFDYDRSRAKFFRSKPINAPVGASAGSSWGVGAPADVTLAEAIHASTNAPVNYFDAPAAFPSHPDRYWDGAITGCNNPVVAAVSEALALGVSPEDMAVLSLGTGTVALPWPGPGDIAPYVQTRTTESTGNDLAKIAGAILDDPPDIASYIAHLMTGAGAGTPPTAGSRIVRMSPMISPVKGQDGNWTVPPGMTVAQFAYLANMGMDAVDPVQVQNITSLATNWISGFVPNLPVRMDGDTLTLEIGQSKFAEAATAWGAIK